MGYHLITMALYLTEDDVGRLLPMEACVEAVEAAFRQWAEGRADNRPRARAAVRGAVLHTLSAGSEVWGRLAAKVYATSREGARFVVLMFDARTSELLAVIEAHRLGQTRTGAASGVASRWLARKDARALGIIGTGWQARSQARAIAIVRRLEVIRAFGRDGERLREFCRETEAACGVKTVPAASAEEAVRGADIVVTATSSAQPVLEGSWLAPGAHVNAVGSNRADRRELDAAAVGRADLIVVDSIEQARLEAGDLLAVDGGAPLGRAVELKEIVAGGHSGRRGDSDITLFKSLGIGLEDLAAASLVYDRAIESGAGRPLPSGGRRDD
jgi:alanine dehydrogenase